MVLSNGDAKPFRSVELDQRSQYFRQLGLNRSRAHALAVGSMKVPDFNLRNIQRQRYRMSVEAGDERQAEVDAIIVKEVTTMIESRQERLKQRPRTPPPPRDIDWHGNRGVPRQRAPSPENFGLTRRFDDHERNEQFRERNDNFRERKDSHRERNDDFRERNDRYREDSFRARHFERNDNFRKADAFNDTPRFMDKIRNSNLDDFGPNQFRDEERSMYNINREPINSNFGLNRRSPSPENFRSNYDDFRDERPRNFQNSNMNDFDDDLRAAPRQLESYRGTSPERGRGRIDVRFDNEPDEQRFYNERNQSYPEDNFRRQPVLDEPFPRNVRNEERRPEFIDDFGPGPNFVSEPSNFVGNNLIDRNEYALNINRYNSDGSLPDERRNFDPDFQDRANMGPDFQPDTMFNNRNQSNWNNNNNNNNPMNPSNWNINNPMNQPNWNNNNNNPRSFGFSGDNPDMMLPSFVGPAQMRNNQQQPRSSSLNSRPSPAQVAQRLNQQKPSPIRTGNNVPKKPLIANAPGNRQTVGMPTKTTNPNPVNAVPKKPLLPAPAGKKDVRHNLVKINTNTNQNPDRPSTSQAASNQLNLATAAPRTDLFTANKRAADATGSGFLTKAEIKRRKLAVKRGFLIGGIKLPYINNSARELPQPEDKSYAITFFEQEPIYNTAIYVTDNDEGDIANIESDENSDDDDAPPAAANQMVFTPGTRKRSAIRKRISTAWTRLYRANNYKCWLNWWKAYKWCEPELNKQLEKFGSLNIRQAFLPNYPKKTTEQVINLVMKSAHFALEENTSSHFRNHKTLYKLMNEVFLENLSLPVIEQLQEMIRGTPNHIWAYKMRSMVYLWAEYYKIATASPIDKAYFAAIRAKWKSPVFHWMCKQAFDELKAISAIEWPDHAKEYARLKSA
ncbi:homeobox protein 5-like [Drosophila montana]|uniref:homeobox protein 5-like n=1 Tax=Drosophila montana TaxID=40370 RepID=UPI00313AF4CE